MLFSPFVFCVHFARAVEFADNNTDAYAKDGGLADFLDGDTDAVREAPDMNAWLRSLGLPVPATTSPGATCPGLGDSAAPQVATTGTLPTSASSTDSHSPWVSWWGNEPIEVELRICDKTYCVTCRL